MAIRKICLIAFIGIASPATAQNNCDALLQHGLSDITTTYGAGHSIVTNYQRHCGSIDESTSNRTVAQAGFEIFGFADGDADADVEQTRRKIQKWCDINSDFAQSNSNFFDEARHINTAAVQAYKSCQQFNRRDIAISVQRDNEFAQKVTITIDSTSDGKFTFLGTDLTGYTCEYFVTTEQEADRVPKSLDSTTRVNIPLENDNIHISCARAEPRDEDISEGIKKLTYEYGSITVITSGPALQLDFPEVVETHFATPKGTILPILGQDCPAGWSTLDEAQGRFLVGSSDTFGLATTGGAAEIPEGGRHGHSTSTSNGVNRGPHPAGWTQAPGKHRHLHGHNVSVAESGEHNHGGNNLPPYLAVTFCRN